MSNDNRVQLQEQLVGQIRQFIAGSILFNQRVADHTGLALTDMQCINVLEVRGPLTAGKLAECTGLSTGGVTVMLDRLEKCGYVKRAPNPRDRRSILVSVNKQKLAGFRSYYEGMYRETVGVLGEFSERELGILNRFFAGLNAIRVEPPPETSGGK